MLSPSDTPPGPHLAPPGDTGALLARTARGAGWVIGWRLATRLLGVVSTLTLVRLLSPADFGVVALGASFAQAVEALGEIGVEEAAIREKAPSRSFLDTAFTLNVVRFASIALVVAVAAIPAGRFFDEPRITPILLALALAYLLEGFTNIGIIEFRRDLAFEREFMLQIVPRIAAIALTILVAAILRSYAALIVGILTTRVLRVAFGYRLHPYRPRFSLQSWRSLIGYSAWSWAITVVQMIRDRSDSIMIGRILSPARVGVYAVGLEVAALSSTELVEPLSRAAFSGFAAARHAGLSAAENYLRMTSTAFLVTLPAGIGIALVADPLVRLAFGPLWADAIPVIRTLGVAFTTSVFGILGANLLSAHAMLASVLSITLASAALRVALLAILIPYYGLPGAALAVAVATVAEQGLYVALTSRRFDLRAGLLMRHIWRTVVASCCMTAVVLGSGIAGGGTADASRLALTLASAALLGVVTYASAISILWIAAGRPNAAESDLLTVLRRLLRRVHRRGR